MRGHKRIRFPILQMRKLRLFEEIAHSQILKCVAELHRCTQICKFSLLVAGRLQFRGKIMTWYPLWGWWLDTGNNIVWGVCVCVCVRARALVGPRLPKSSGSLRCPGSSSLCLGPPGQGFWTTHNFSSCLNEGSASVFQRRIPWARDVFKSRGRPWLLPATLGTNLPSPRLIPISATPSQVWFLAFNLHSPG